MPEEKTTDCKIFDKEDHKLLLEGTIRISRLKVQGNGDSLASYEGQISFLDFQPDLDSKSVILEIKPGLSGSVFLHAPAVQTSTTRLGGLMNVSFEDSAWGFDDWFSTL